MKIIDGKGAILGRLASHVAKAALKGEEVAVLNCKEIIITGNRKNIEKNYLGKRLRVGSAQKGPKHSRLAHLIVKRTIRGMLPRAKDGRGRLAFKRIKCYPNVPKEFEGKKTEKFSHDKKKKFIEVGKIAK